MLLPFVIVQSPVIEIPIFWFGFSVVLYRTILKNGNENLIGHLRQSFGKINKMFTYCGEDVARLLRYAVLIQS